MYAVLHSESLDAPSGEVTRTASRSLLLQVLLLLEMAILLMTLLLLQLLLLLEMAILLSAGHPSSISHASDSVRLLQHVHGPALFQAAPGCLHMHGPAMPQAASGLCSTYMGLSKPRSVAP